jgi:hypothetical protein
MLPEPTFPAGSFNGRPIAFTSWHGYGANLPELQQALLEKISTDARVQFDPKAQALQDSVKKILDTASGGKLSQAAAAQAKAAAAANKPGAAPKK